MEENISVRHERIFKYLKRLSERTPNFKFSLRRSDRGGRLGRGYWFHGNEHYLAVSFWSGMDWKNKTPNIFFVIPYNDSQTYLEISVSDSELKTEFIEKYFLNSDLDIQREGYRYKKYYDESDYFKSLKQFLRIDKEIIDSIISKNISFFNDESSDNSVGFIDQKAFKARLNKITSLRSKFLGSQIINHTLYLSSIRIRNFGHIDNLFFDQIDEEPQWIFLTGENGCGKTTILRAIAIALSKDAMSYFDLGDSGHFSISAELSKGKEIIESNIDASSFLNVDRNLMGSGFACYGPFRLIIADIDIRRKYSQEDLNIRMSNCYSLFNNDGVLIDIDEEIVKWTNQSFLYERVSIIKETLLELIPNLKNILYTNGQNIYQECDNLQNAYPPVPFNQLASGIRSLIAMLGDMMYRLFESQKEIEDVSELSGIVLIDEIDLHFHPKYQKALVEILSETFPNVQFIATTHSPIPLLGAPADSLIYTVERRAKEGVLVKRLDNRIAWNNLLPNTILSSPIFGFGNLTATSRKENEFIRVEENYSQIEFNDKVRKEIREFLNDEKEIELINLFKKQSNNEISE